MIRRSIFEQALAFLRSRLLGAVTLPALIGGALAYRRGRFRWPDFLIALAGLAAVELLNLFGTDYLKHRRGQRTSGSAQRRSSPLFPGNPVIPPERLKPEKLPAVLLLLALAGAGVLLYFTLTVGPSVLAFLGPAAMIGALYVLSPFPYAFLATALIPPLISGGVAYVLIGRAETASFLVGLPVTWISAGVILTYRVAYAGAGRQSPGARRLIALLPYGAAAANVIAFVLMGLYSLLALLSLIPFTLFIVWVSRLIAIERQDPVPATAAGVFLHTAVSLLVALSLLFGS